MYAMNNKGWPVNFSFGAVTFNQFSSKVDEMLNIVDKCMYEAKNGGKNKIIYKTFNECIAYGIGVFCPCHSASI
jgi:hypothetical protein